MKICYSNPTFLMKRPISEIAMKLSKEEYSVSVLTPRKVFEKRDKSLHHADLRGVNVVDYSCIDLPGQSEWPILNPFFFFTAWKMLKENDVVHMWVPFYKSNTIIALLKNLFFRNKKLILTMDTIPGYSFSMGALDPAFRLYYRTFGKMVFSAADKITIYGNSMKKFAKKAGVPMDKLEITPTGVDLKVKKKDKDVRKKWKIDKKEKIVLFMGILVDRKGIDTIIKVAEKFQGKKKRVKFLILGDGPNREKYEQDVKDKKLKNVIFTGFRKDIHNFCHEADVFFLPSRGEGMAGVIMEALSYGLPVVSSNIPGTIDILDSENLCSVENVDCYCKKISKTLKKGKKKSNSKDLIRAYSWDKNIKHYKLLYK